MPEENWVTYNRLQAAQVASGLQVLLEQNVLDEKEREVAKRAQRKLVRWREDSDINMFLLNKKEYELISQVEAALWR